MERKSEGARAGEGARESARTRSREMQRAPATGIEMAHNLRAILFVSKICKDTFRDLSKDCELLGRGALEKEALRLTFAPGHELIGVDYISHILACAAHARSKYTM